MNSLKVCGVLFDLDGVLVDAADWHKDALNLSLKAYGFAPIGEDEHINDFNGLSTRRKLQMLVERERIPDNKVIHSSINYTKQEYTIELIEKNCKPTGRVTEVLAYARSIDLKTACVTNCSRNTAELMLEKSNIIDLFDTIVTNNDVDGRIKPNPWPYILAKSNLGLINRNCLAIDDTEKGIMSAMNADCRPWRINSFGELTVKNLINKIKRISTI